MPFCYTSSVLTLLAKAKREDFFILYAKWSNLIQNRVLFVA